jgi:ankyrin repeat protein
MCEDRRMDIAATPMTLAEDDPRAAEMFLAIRGGDLDKVRALLAREPGLAGARVAGRRGGWRTPLHMVTDWPGFFPQGPAIVRLLAAAGADLNDREDKPRSEAPLHWAASNDDVEVAQALIDAGADTGLPGGSIGTPLANAIGYGCWAVARLLVARGARVETLWQAAALGDRPRLEELLAADPPPASEEIDHAFYQGCRGGYLRIVATLFERGANVNYIPDYSDQTGLQVADGDSTGHQALREWLREHGGAAADAASAGGAADTEA